MKPYLKSKRNLILVFLPNIINTRTSEMLGAGCEYIRYLFNDKCLTLRLTIEEIHKIQKMCLEGKLWK